MNNEKSVPGPLSGQGAMEVFLAQLRQVTEQLTGVKGPRSQLRLPSPPGALSAQQLEATMAEVAARRQQVEALRAQLSAFDEQLALLEGTLRPLVEWSRTWADLERTFYDLWQPRSSG